MTGCDDGCGSASKVASSATQAATSEQQSSAVRMPTQWEADYDLPGWRRARLAYKNKRDTVRALFRTAKVTFPPRQLLFRAFKKEKRMEVWASSKRTGKLTLITTYGICYASGAVGPKLREGDKQVPEGFYTIDYYNNSSSYYLSMRVNYPNRRDRQLRRTGSLIMIHGNCVSVGCLAMTDERIQELWVMADSARRHNRVTVRVHIFPTRDLTTLIAATTAPDLKEFWTNLAQGYTYFETHHRLPRIRSNRAGTYLFR